MDTKNLESKVWFRLLKVLFVFAYVVTLIAVLGFAYSLKPYTTTDTYNSLIVCDNGTTYKAGDVGIDAEEAFMESQFGATPIYKNGSIPNTTANDEATTLCETAPEQQLRAFPLVPAYKVELVNKTVGNWWGFAGYTALALLIVIVIFELIKRSFLYVVTGKKFFSRRQIEN